MTPDESETKDEALPPAVERALAEARAPGAAKSSRWLALIPVTAAVLMFLLLVPRATPPEDIPLPQLDGVGLRAVIADDAARAAAARANRLPTDILAVGSALRGLNHAMASKESEAVGPARAVLDDALRGVAGRDPQQVIEQLKTLRAVQVEEFLAEVVRFESTGQPSAELVELSGSFIERMTDAGWVKGREVLLDDAQRRAAFKLVWSAMVGGERSPDLALAIDEQRALYTLYFLHPHVPDAERSSFEAMRRGAGTAEDCQALAGKERLAAEIWRAEKIKKLGEIDTTYPTSYALGVAYYRAGRYDMSMNAFRAWIEAHPEGALALRARNHWKAAFSANGPS